MASTKVMIVGMEIAIKRRSIEIQHSESFLNSTIPLRKVNTAGIKAAPPNQNPTWSFVGCIVSNTIIAHANPASNTAKRR